MKPASPLFSLLLLCASNAAAWTRVDHWQTNVITTTSKKLFTSSIPVYPTGPVTPSPISSNVSVTTYSTAAAGPFMLSRHTYEVTVTDLFFADDAEGLCISTGFSRCTPTPTFDPLATSSIITQYWHPMVVANPSSCTLTSYAYTTRQTVDPAGLTEVPDAAEQATDTDGEALFVTTWISTKSTNLGGQAVTTTICDVYLRDGAVGGVAPGYELSAMSQCVDPRVLSCSIETELTPTASCATAGQTYPPTAEAANGGGGGGGGSGSGPAATGAGGGSTKPGAAAGLGVRMSMVLAVPAVVAAVML